MTTSRKAHIGEWTFDPSRNRLVGATRTLVLTPLQASVLAYFAEHRNEVVSADELVNALWNRRIVGDSPVYRVIADLRQALADDAKAPRYIETIRKRGYRFIAEVDWLKESQQPPDSRSIDTESEPGRRRASRPGFVAAVLLAVASTALLIATLLLEDAPSTDSGPMPTAAANTVAVLPFVSLTGDVEDEYLGDGLAEVLIHQLSEVPNLKVIARTSSFAFRHENLDVREIGRRLGVASILEGSVQRYGETLRITAQLLDAGTGTHHWSKQFNRAPEDIFSIQDEIAREVVAALPQELLLTGAHTAATRTGTENLQAFDAYLRGLKQLSIGSTESLPRAIGHFERAIAIDEEFDDARLGLLETYNAQNYIFQIDYGEIIIRNSTIPLEILARNPNNARAMAFLAVADFSKFFPTGSGEAERLWKRALELSPHDPVVLSWYAYYMSWNDHPGEAMGLLEHALRVDPYAPDVLARAAREGKMEYAERLRHVHPDNPAGWSIAGELHVRSGDLVKAFEFFRIAEQKSPRNHEFPAMLAMVLLTVGLNDEAESAVLRAESKGPGEAVTVAARIALEHRRGNVERAGEMALNALHNHLPPRQFSVIVIMTLALQHALRTDDPLAFIAAVVEWLKTPGIAETPDLTMLDIRAPIELNLVLLSVPAFQAAGEAAIARRQLDKARRAFESGSERLKREETRYKLDLYEGNIESALDVLSTLVDSGRGGFQPAYFTNPSEFRWWLEFEEILAEPFDDEPRYARILEQREAHLATERAAIEVLIREQ